MLARVKSIFEYILVTAIGITYCGFIFMTVIDVQRIRDFVESILGG